MTKQCLQQVISGAWENDIKNLSIGKATMPSRRPVADPPLVRTQGEEGRVRFHRVGTSVRGLQAQTKR